MKIIQSEKGLIIQGRNYVLKHDTARCMYVDLTFNNGIGAELFIPSACDCNGFIDEIRELELPAINQTSDCVEVCFAGKTTLWKEARYIFTCFPDKVLYGYRVYGKGDLDNARFFEGFLENDPRMKDAFYPYYCGPGRHKSYHRPAKFFMNSSRPEFDIVYTFSVNSSDARSVMYYEDVKVRACGDRFYLGGDWLVTPPPFLYLLGRQDKKDWVSMGLVVKAGENNFQEYHYSGGEGFGLNLTYDGYTKIDGVWESPQILMEQTSGEVYDALNKYIGFLLDNGYAKKKNRSNSPQWWYEPIFGGWGEQVFFSNRWVNYFKGKSDDWTDDDVDGLCTQEAYEKMLWQLEAKEINPTILIVDNRWFQLRDQLTVDKLLWPSMDEFIRQQHKKGRKIILWVSPWSYCSSGTGKDVPLSEQMVFDETEAYNLEIDTDVFYKACNRDKRKIRVELKTGKPTLAEPNWKFLTDPLNPEYEKRLCQKVSYLLSPEGLDADGFEFDYTHFMPKYRGMKPIRQYEQRFWGVELLHKLIEIYYKQAKKSKPESLIISHTFNPYFNDVVDMLRLQDIYTDRRSIVPTMTHRAAIAKNVCPGCAIHSDQHPMPSLEAWREYMKFQPTIGNPCLYYVTGIETTHERFAEEDFVMLKEIWSKYRAELKKRYVEKEKTDNSHESSVRLLLKN